MENNDEKLLDHNYDGIRELDNKLPPWWLYLFYFTIAFASIYTISYFGFGKFRQIDEYHQELSTAKKQIKKYKAANGTGIDETNVTLTTTKDALNNGSKVFAKNCTPCHRADGGGGVGPNLTDSYWLHGNKIKNLFKTIKYGVPEKGMIAWGKTLTPEQMQDVASYILTNLKDKNVAGGKDPQGTKM